MYYVHTLWEQKVGQQINAAEKEFWRNYRFASMAGITSEEIGRRVKVDKDELRYIEEKMLMSDEQIKINEYQESPIGPQ